MAKRKRKRKGIADVVGADPHVKAIIPAERLNIPEVNPNLWVPSRREKRGKDIRLLREFLRQPLIVDDFGQDHDARIKWRKRMQSRHPHFNEYWSSNALQYNNLVGIRWLLCTFGKGYCGTQGNEFEEKRESAAQAIPENPIYKGMLDEDKFKTVVKAKEKVRDLLEFLSEQSPAHPKNRA